MRRHLKLSGVWTKDFIRIKSVFGWRDIVDTCPLIHFVAVKISQGYCKEFA